MEMTTNEIKTSYKTAKYPEEQIKVLADLNNVSPGEIRKVIGGDLIADAKRRPGRPSREPKGTTSEYVRRLVEKRMEELEEIIKAFEDEYSELADFLKKG